MKEIGGSVAVITGAARGPGRHIAETLFDHGLKVVITGRDADALEVVRTGFDRTGRRSLALPGDMTDARHRASLLDASVQKFGSVDILVNNAGLQGPERLVGTSLERIRSMFDINVIAVVDLARLALPAMVERRRGHIVNLAPFAGPAAAPFASSYSATLHAVLGFSLSLRQEVADEGVGVSVVCPGPVRDDGPPRHGIRDDPAAQPTISPEQVADAVVRAITGNRDRVVVGPRLPRLSPMADSVSPAMRAVVARLSGPFATVREMAGWVKRQEP